MAVIEYWRWRYRDPKTSRLCQTLSRMTAEEAAKYPEAERIPGSMLLREVDEEAFSETSPGAFLLQSK